MKKQKNVLGIFLAVVSGGALLAALFIQAFFPRVILPRLDAPALVLLSLIALVLDHYFAEQSSRNYWPIPLYGALIFGLFPLAAQFAAPLRAGYLALLGAGVFTAVTFLFDTILERLSSGPAGKLAPLISGLGLYLAAQCLMGIL